MGSKVQEAIDTKILTPVIRNNENLFLCVPCNTEVTGAIPAAAHLDGSKHMKAMRRFLDNSAQEDGRNILSDDGKRKHFIKGDVANFQQLLAEGILKEIVNNGILYYRCCVCNCDMSGDIPTKSHLEGGSHAKKLKVTGLKNIYPVSPSNLMSSTRIEVASPISSSACAPEKSLHNISNISLPTVDNFSTVDTSLNKSTRLAQHVESGMLTCYSKLGALYYDCTVCNCSLSGEVPAIAHIDGKPHKRAALRKELQPSSYSNSLRAASSNSSMQSLQSVDSTDGGAVALATGKQIPSSSVMDATASLSAKMAAVALSDARQTSSTSLLSSALSDGVLRHDQDAPLADSYYCVVCQGAAMIGPITADMHLRGKNHAKAVKRKGIMAGTSGVPSRSSSSSRDGDVDTDNENSVVTSDVAAAAASTANASHIVDEALLTRHSLFAMKDANGVPGYECFLCGTVSRSYRDVAAHISGDKHRRNVKKYEASTALDSDDSSPSPTNISPVQMSATPARTIQMDNEMGHVLIVEAWEPVTKEMLNFA